jgi:aspartate/methionine/tyrosine aminotransferase
MPFPVVLARLLIRLGLGRYLPGVRRHLTGSSPVLRHLSDSVLRTPVDLLERLAQEFESQPPQIIDLTAGAPTFDLLPTGTSKLPAHRRSLPPLQGLLELRLAVAEKLLLDSRLAFNPAEEIAITSGALGAIQLVCDAFVSPGSKVLLCDPTSPAYSLAVRARGGKVRWLPTWTEDGHTRFRLHDVARLLPGCSLVVLVDPGNPTGGVFRPEDLEQLAWWARRSNALILSDDTFHRYTYGHEPVSIGTLAEARSRTLTIGSVSKSHALTAARVGWLAGPRALLLPCLASAATRACFVPMLSQMLAQTALRTPPEAFEPYRTEFAGRLTFGCERLEGIGLPVAVPSAGLFLWVPVWRAGHDGRDLARQLREEEKVAVTPGDLFGPSGKGFVRISLATEQGRLEEGLNRLARFLQREETREQERQARAA